MAEYKIVDDEQKGKVIKIPCVACGTKTNHEHLHNYDIQGTQYLDDTRGASIDWSDDYQILKCGGCDSVSFRHVSWFSEDYDPQDEENFGARVTLYPRREKEGIQLKEYQNLPSNLKRIYRETIDCINSESNTLAAAGLRALVEGICAELKVLNGPVVTKEGQTLTKDNLEGKINGLAEKGILTRESADVLHQHRFLGNDAVHALKHPPFEELQLAIEIIEHTIKSVFEMPKVHNTLQSSRAKNLKNKVKND